MCGTYHITNIMVGYLRNPYELNRNLEFLHDPQLETGLRHMFIFERQCLAILTYVKNNIHSSIQLWRKKWTNFIKIVYLVSDIGEKK